MNPKRRLLFRMIPGILIVAAIGFLGLPFAVKDFALMPGILAYVGLVSMVLLLWLAWKKKNQLFDLPDRNQNAEDFEGRGKTYAKILISTSAFIVLGGLVNGILLYLQNEDFKLQIQDQNVKIEKQSEMIESISQSNQALMIRDILDQVNFELKSNPDRTLSVETIGRIVSLSYSFQPYKIIEGDSVSTKMFSPERGQLLLALFMMRIDSNSFDTIKLKTDFSGADLRGADFHGAELTGVNLKEANLREANLEGANLEGANLSAADLWGANLRNANLSGANLKWSDLSWSDLNGSDLRGADLTAVDLRNVKLKKANLQGSNLKRADFTGGLMSEANLSSANLTGTDLTRTNLTSADFTDANLSETDLTEANMHAVNLTNAVVERKKWFETLTEWRVAGVKELQEKYKMVEDLSGRSNFRFERIVN